MIERRRTRFLAVFGLLLALALPGTARASGEEAPFLLILEGSPAVKFVMICDVIDGSAREQVRRRNLLAHSYRFAVDAIDCRITLLDDHGRLEVYLYEGERLIAAEDSIATRAAIGVRSGGPWGPPAAWRDISGRRVR